MLFLGSPMTTVLICDNWYFSQKKVWSSCINIVVYFYNSWRCFASFLYRELPLRRSAATLIHYSNLRFIPKISLPSINSNFHSPHATPILANLTVSILADILYFAGSRRNHQRDRRRGRIGSRRRRARDRDRKQGWRRQGLGSETIGASCERGTRRWRGEGDPKIWHSYL